MARPKKEKTEAPAPGGEAPQVRGTEGVDPHKQVMDKEHAKYVNSVQKRVFERQEAVRKEKEDRKEAILKQAEDAAKEIKPIFIPYKDRNGDIVPALVLGVEDIQKKDKAGPVLNENNEPVMEAKLKVYVFSNIDEPRKVLYSFEDGGK